MLNRLGSRNRCCTFETAVPGEAHALPADNVQIDPNKGISHRTSPTSIGLYLVSLLAAEKLRLLPAAEAARRIGETLSTLEALPKWQGHLYSRYDTRTLEPLPPPFGFFGGQRASGRLPDCLRTGIACAAACAAGRASVTFPSGRTRWPGGMNFSVLFDPDAELFWSRVFIPDQPNENR